MDQKYKTRDGAGSISGDSTITMLSASPSPPPDFREPMHIDREQIHDPRHPSGDSAVVMSGTTPSPSPTIGRVPTFDEFMGPGPDPYSRASSEASTIILPGNSPKPAGMPSDEEASNSVGWAASQTHISLHHSSCTLRDELSGQCVCMCTGPCFVQENAALAAEIANLFPEATRQQLGSLSVADVVYRFLGNAYDPSQVGNPIPVTVGESNGNGDNVIHQCADSFYSAQRGVQMLLDADAFLSALDAWRQARIQNRPDVMPRIEEEPQQPSGIVNRVESGTDNDTEMNVDESDDETIIAPESDEEMTMSVASTETYIPSSGSSLSDLDS